MDQPLIQMISDLGGTLGSLMACFWYIKYQSDQHAERERRWMDKDTSSDEAMRQMMRDSNSQLMTVLSETNNNLKQMSIALTELKEVIHGRDSN